MNRQEHFLFARIVIAVFAKDQETIDKIAKTSYDIGEMEKELFGEQR